MLLCPSIYYYLIIMLSYFTKYIFGNKSNNTPSPKSFYREFGIRPTCENMTYEICMNLVSKNGAEIVYVPHKFLDLEMCKIAMNNEIFEVDTHIYHKFVSLFEQKSSLVFKNENEYLPNISCHHKNKKCIFNNPECVSNSSNHRCLLIYKIDDPNRLEYIVDDEIRKQYQNYVNFRYEYTKSAKNIQ